ncbi:hypothetical protein [Dactylosporangium sp. NPDC006015]|uniref:hypothetical protein n=1 Tax=Dactylosporangium sp. NPDC006015 TaxID=3154576 RepID=UPI0033A6F9B9
MGDTQHGLIARSQLTAAGVTRSQLRWRLHTGRWTAPLPGVYATFSGELSPHQQAIAALLYGGPAACLTGAAALVVHGFHTAPRERCVRIVVPCNRRVPSTGFVRVHRTTRPDLFSRRYGPLRVTSPERCVVEASRLCTDPGRVRAMVAEAVQSAHCTVEDLTRELAAAPKAGTAVLRRAVAEVLAGVRSIAEGEARALLARSTVLPAMLWNPVLKTLDGMALPSPDGWIPDVGLALEVDSRSYHLSPEDWERNLHRHARLAEAGAVVLHFSPQQIHRDPAWFVASVERSYLARLTANPSPLIRTVPR